MWMVIENRHIMPQTAFKVFTDASKQTGRLQCCAWQTAIGFSQITVFNLKLHVIRFENWRKKHWQACTNFRHQSSQRLLGQMILLNISNNVFDQRSYCLRYVIGYLQYFELLLFHYSKSICNVSSPSQFRSSYWYGWMTKFASFLY